MHECCHTKACAHWPMQTPAPYRASAAPPSPAAPAAVAAAASPPPPARPEPERSAGRGLKPLPTYRPCSTWGQPQLAYRFGGKFEAEGGCAGPGGKVDAPELPLGPGWEIQEVSRLGAQGVTSKSKLLAREMPRVCSRGLRVDSEAAKSLKVAPAQSGSKSMRRSSPRDLDGRCRR